MQLNLTHDMPEWYIVTENGRGLSDTPTLIAIARKEMSEIDIYAEGYEGPDNRFSIYTNDPTDEWDTTDESLTSNPDNHDYDYCFHFHKDRFSVYVAELPETVEGYTDVRRNYEGLLPF